MTIRHGLEKLASLISGQLHGFNIKFHSCISTLVRIFVNADHRPVHNTADKIL